MNDINDILKNYYSLIDGYNIDNKDFEYFDDSEPEEQIFFKVMSPINICLLLRCLEPIINVIS